MVLYARDIVETDFLALAPDMTVLQGAKAMKDSKHGFAVIGQKEKPQGIVTEWDVLSQVVAEDRDPNKVTMGEIMSKDLVYVEGSTGLSTVSQLMTQKGVRRLLVEENGVVTGVITARIMLARMKDYVDKVSSQISRMQAPWI
jgi:malate dehydrogenase (oxaloacetate-decarboxylating)